MKPILDPRPDDARVRMWCGLRETRKEAVVRLRREGYTLRAIAEGLGISPPTASMDLYLSGEGRLLRADHRELAVRREAVIRDKDPDEHVVEWRIKALENSRRKAAERAQDRLHRLWFENPLSLDEVIPDTDLLRGDSVAAPASTDPAVALSERDVEEVLGDLTVEDVGRMDEYELVSLRERLLDLGVAPASVQRRERGRLQVIEPHRGLASGPPPSRQGMTPERKSRKSRSQGHKNRGKRFDRRKTKWREAA